MRELIHHSSFTFKIVQTALGGSIGKRIYIMNLKLTIVCKGLYLAADLCIGLGLRSKDQCPFDKKLNSHRSRMSEQKPNNFIYLPTSIIK